MKDAANQSSNRGAILEILLPKKLGNFELEETTFMQKTMPKTLVFKENC
jgi:hypothetical protein